MCHLGCSTYVFGHHFTTATATATGEKTCAKRGHLWNKTAGKGRVATTLDTSNLIDMQEVPGSSPVSPTIENSRSKGGFLFSGRLRSTLRKTFDCDLTAMGREWIFLALAKLQCGCLSYRILSILKDSNRLIPQGIPKGLNGDSPRVSYNLALRDAQKTLMPPT